MSETNGQRGTAEREIVDKRLKFFLGRHTEVCEVGVQGGGIFEMKDPVQYQDDLPSARLNQGPDSSPQPVHVSSQPPRASTMATEPPRPKGRDNTLPALNTAIDALNLTKEASSIDAPAKAVFGSVCVLLTTIRVRGLQFCESGLPIHASPGLHVQRTGVR